MNKLNVFHGDIKDGNVLVKITEMGLETRLIDWGLSFIHHDDTGIPRKIYRRPFQYNVPFSSILFNKEFLKKYNEFLAMHPNPNYYQIREFVVNYIFIWNEIRGPGHLTAINDIVKKLTINDVSAIKKTKVKEHIIEYDFTYYYIIEYLSKILEKYTQNGKIELLSYFNTIFLKNIDIWGFTMTYIVLYEHLYDSFNTLTEFQMQFINKLKYIIVYFLYETPIEPINTSLLIDELTNLNSIIEKFDINKPSKKLEYLQNTTSTHNSGGKSTQTKRYKIKSSNKTRKKH